MTTDTTSLSDMPAFDEILTQRVSLPTLDSVCFKWPVEGWTSLATGAHALPTFECAGVQFHFEVLKQEDGGLGFLLKLEEHLLVDVLPAQFGMYLCSSSNPVIKTETKSFSFSFL